MKAVRPILIIASMMMTLTACSNTSTRSPTRLASNFIQNQKISITSPESYPSKNPHQVTVYSEKHTPRSPYKVIANASVFKKNLLGIKRNDNDVQAMIKQLAASVGGDGLINVKNQPKELQAQVIAYQKILI